jgi:hypothetical protein
VVCAGVLSEPDGAVIHFCCALAAPLSRTAHITMINRRIGSSSKKYGGRFGCDPGFYSSPCLNITLSKVGPLPALPIINNQAAFMISLIVGDSAIKTLKTENELVQIAVETARKTGKCDAITASSIWVLKVASEFIQVAQ